MRRISWFVASGLAAALAAAAPPLFRSASESAWSVASGGKEVGTLLVLTDGRSVRAEWSGGGKAPRVFIATEGKIWVRDAGGDVELAEWKGGDETLVVPALLLPHTTTARDATTMDGGRPASYTYGGAVASYAWDEAAPTQVQIRSGGRTWSVTRTRLATPSSADASLYAVKPKRRATSRLAALAGGLLGPSDKSVSATAGGRGVEKGGRFADGGDYDALAALETADDVWDAESAEELAKFQKEGRIGRSRGGDR